MRPLKFRAWDKLQKKFLYPYPEGFDILGETTCFDLIGQQIKDFTPNLTTLDRLNDIIIIQFTGIQDKYGKDVYEGDILKDTEFDDDDFDISGYYPIIYDDKTCQFCIDNSFKKDGSHLVNIVEYFRIENIEVVGNIYETPELLNCKYR